jgi:hypothetical protein
MNEAMKRPGAGRTPKTILCLLLVGASGLALVGCGGASSPTTVPTPIPTPTPVPTPTPDPNVPPAGSGCGKPYPPMITRWGVKVLYRGAEYHTVDATPLVGPNIDYCQSIGFTDGRSICPIRPEGVADREACEVWRSGIAKDTGQPGPTWTWIENGTGRTSYCSSAAGAPCDRSPNGPFTVKAYKSGVYRICTEAGACGETEVDR